jgi:putative inorganic carbon (HCO3(-)) transporter
MKTGFDALSAYNIYLETAVESGIFALIAFLGFLFTVCYQGIKFVLSSENIEKIVYISACVIAIFAIMFHGLVDTIYFRPQLQFVFWTYIAVITAILSGKN